MPSEDRAIRVFVSSTFIDNETRRKIVEDAIVSAGMVPEGMERFTASTKTTVEACKELVGGCDWQSASARSTDISDTQIRRTLATPTSSSVHI